MARKVVALALVVSFGALTFACGSRTAPASAPVEPQIPSTPEPLPSPPKAADPPIEAEPIDCALIAESGDPVTTVALTERVEPSNAPYPSNDSERLVFRQLYETLVRVDCKGRVRPGLAASWRLDADGRTWMVILRENARFSDGTPVTPIDVRASWTRDGIADDLRPQVRRLVQSIVAVDDRTVAVTLRRQQGDAPLALAHTDLAIAKAAGSAWPLGTRSDRTQFVGASGDPRDVLDDGVDLLLTRDPATLQYAATLPQFRSVPLEWQRTHVLVPSARARTAPLLPEPARLTLADDAIRGEARSAVGPFWWETLQDCSVAAFQPRDQSAPTSRIVFDGRDGAARDLAERLVGLNRSLRAAGLTGESLAVARRRGADAGYILWLERRPLDACRELQALMDDVRWLDPKSIVPLVETRLHAIVRRGRSGVTAEWDGGLLIEGASAREKR